MLSKEFLIRVYINDIDTGDLIEKINLDLVDEDNEFENAEDLHTYIDDNHDEFLEFVDNVSKYKRNSGDIYRIDVVCLETEEIQEE